MEPGKRTLDREFPVQTFSVVIDGGLGLHKGGYATPMAQRKVLGKIRKMG